MELALSETALEIIKLGEMNEAETIKYMREHHDPLSSVKMIIGGYTTELLRTAGEADIELDLTYETIKNITAAAMLLYNKQHSNEYDDERNRKVTCRTIAGYFVTLAINNHDLGIEAKSYSNKANEDRPEQWSDMFVIKFDHKKNSDFLPFVWEGANGSPVEIDNGFTIDVNPLIEAYLRVTGVNLAEKGLANMILTCGDKEPEEKQQ